MSPRLLLPLLAASLVASCTNPGPAATPAPAAAQPAAAPAAPAAPLAASKVAKVVFVGKQEACDCTRKAIDASRAALTAALGAKGPVLVEELLSDAEAEKVAPYRALKPFLSLPALYFVDSNDGIVTLLQGELTEAQIKAALSSPVAGELR